MATHLALVHQQLWFMGVKTRLRAWYRGKYVPPPPNDPNSSIVFISPGHYEQPALARLLNMVGRFCLAHWQWVTGTLLAVIGILLSLRG